MSPNRTKFHEAVEKLRAAAADADDDLDPFLLDVIEIVGDAVIRIADAADGEKQ